MENLLLKLSRSFKPSDAKMRWVISGEDGEWLDYEDSQYVWVDAESEENAGWYDEKMLDLSNWLLKTSYSSAGDKKIRIISNQPSGRTARFEYVPRDDSTEEKYPVAGYAENYALFFEGCAHEIDIQPARDVEAMDDEVEFDLKTTDYVSNHMESKVHRDMLDVQEDTYIGGMTMDEMMQYLIPGMIAFFFVIILVSVI